MEPVLNSKFTFLESHEIVSDDQEIPTAEDFSDIRKDLIDELCREESSSTSHLIPERNSSVTKDHMSVYLRIRPFTEAEIAQNESQDCVFIENSTSVILKAPQSSLSSRCSDRGFGQMAQRFRFSHVYGPETKQREIFGAVKPFIEEVLNGQNCLIFTYGVTNSGKTYTFQGPDHDVGIIPRAMSLLFKSIEGKVYQNMNIKPQRSADFSKLTDIQVKEEETLKKSVLHLLNESDQCNGSNQHSSLDATEAGESLKSLSIDYGEELKCSEEVAVRAPERFRFSIWVSFCEIYNETLYDLLDPVPCKYQKRNILRLVQDAKGNTYVKDLKWIQVSNAKEACMILKQGRKQQSIASTKVNHLSSRSHCTFSIRILHMEADGLRVARVSELSLCDLAGSERNAKTKNEGDRLKEAGNINTSLLILGKCINALRHNQISKTHSHVPFRESKLTRYFQGYFSGRGKVCMIVNINQCASMYEETLNVLKFSAVAQKKLLVYIQDLKNKIVEEKKEKVIMENKIREEVCQEMEKYMSQFENAFRERAKEDSRLTEDRIEKRNNIFQTLVKTYVAIDQNENSISEECIEPEISQLSNPPNLSKYESLVNTNVMGYIKSLEPDVAEIKKQAEIIQHHLVSAPDPQETIAQLEARLACVIQELNETNEVLNKNTAELETHKKTEFERKSNEAHKEMEIKKLMDELILKDADLNKVKNLLAIYEERMDEYSKTMESIQGMLETYSRTEVPNNTLMENPSTNSKCTYESYQQEDEPPSKKGSLNKELYKCTSMKTLEQKVEGMRNELTAKERAVITLHEEIQNLKDQLILAQENLNNDKSLNEELNQCVERLRLDLTTSAETIHKLTEQIENENSNYEKLGLELKFEKELNMQQSQKIKLLQTEMELCRNEVTQREVQNKTLEDKIDTLRNFQKESELSIAELKCTKDLLQNEKKESLKKVTEIESLQKQLSILAQELDEAKAVVQRRDSGPFRKTIEKLQKECEVIVKLSSQKSQQIQDLNEELKSLKKQKADLQATCTELKVNETTTQNLLQEKDVELKEFKANFKETENKMEALMQNKGKIVDLEKEIENYRHIMEARELEISKNKGNLTRFEEQLKEREEYIANLQNNLKCMEKKLVDSNKCVDDLKLNLKSQEVRFKKEVREVQDNWHATQETLSKKEEELESKHLEFNKLRIELSENASECQRLAVDLQRKDEEYRELKEKYVDVKKQMQQIEAEISSKREEEKSLRQTVSELERMKKQTIQELNTKERMVQQYKQACQNEADLKNKVEMLMTNLNEKEAALRGLENLLEESKTQHQVREQQGSNEENKAMPDPRNVPVDIKIEETIHLLQTTTKELQDKERLIQDMKITLTEQEQTQTEQDELLEAKLNEIEELNAELEKWRHQAKKLEKECDALERNHLVENAHQAVNTETTEFQGEMEALKKQLVEMEEKQTSNREKWLNEKMLLFKQIKEAEGQRNKEMRKWTEEREHYSKLQSEMENLKSEIVKKENEMQKWREERDSLVKELEVQLRSLVTSNKQKDEEIKKLRASEKECSVESETVFDSSEISTENGERSRRFPKPEVEIHFAPLQPNKLSVKESSGNLINVKIPRTNRKRKSFAMEENDDDCENRKNIIVSRMGHNASPLVSTPTNSSMAEKDAKGPTDRIEKNCPVSSLRSHKKKDGTLQKIGDLLQNSPTTLQSKAKKLMETLSSSKNLEVEATCNNSKPKRARRKLYKQDISSPMNFPSQPIIELNNKESDHLIMKRRLRTRSTKVTK
ncbi:kinesin-like protein KIF20B isoform X4 [Mobula birostris]|uniref:kinesin-like protein KIF20B isoform X4 n=1 Tax=Mobula birostris TaxID=1983395 RepID=UPI003B28D655